MRQLMTILAIFGFLAAPPVSAAEDPFDFSSPLPTSASERRTAQYFSRSPGSEAKSQPAPAQAADTPSRYRREQSEMSAERPKNYAADLFGKARQATVDDRPPTVSFSRQMARERQPAPEASPQETLRRFDEFLKTRDVISAGYSRSADHQERSAIRQVQAAGGDEPFDDLPSFGDLDTVPAEQPRSTSPPAVPPRNPLFEVQPAPPPRPQHDRLTDPISTDSSFSEVPARESNPFATEPASVTPRREVRTAFPPQQIPDRRQIVSNPVEREYAAPKYYAASSTSTADVNTGSTSSPAVRTSWSLLSPLNLGQECTAELTLTNPSDETAQRVSLEVHLPESIRFVQAAPAPVEQRSFLGWKFNELAAGESRTIQIVFVASAAGPLNLSSHVRHTSSQSESFTVAQPQLDVAVSGPTEVHVGEPASQTVILKNPGTGVATNVQLQAVIPAGLEHARGERLLMEIGSLNPGEVRSVRLGMRAVGGGDHILQVQANADSGLVQTAAATVTVIAPSLRAGIEGPSLRYLGREAEYTIRVLNDGSSPTDFVQVNHRVPEGFDFISADRGAKFDAATRLLNWYVGALQSNESQDIKIKLIARVTGSFAHEVRATSEHGAQADAQLATRIEGAASLVLEVSDLEDPVEVGSETVYEITITNEGTASAHDVGLACEVPRGLSLINAQGPSDYRVQAEMIGFRPIDELPAGKSLTYRVQVQGGAAGDLRFRCRLTSESLTQPLFTEELTKFYGE